MNTNITFQFSINLRGGTRISRLGAPTLVRGRQPPTRALFGKNVKAKVGPNGEAGNIVCRSATEPVFVSNLDVASDKDEDVICNDL